MMFPPVPRWRASLLAALVALATFCPLARGGTLTTFSYNFTTNPLAINPSFSPTASPPLIPNVTAPTVNTGTSNGNVAVGTGIGLGVQSGSEVLAGALVGGFGVIGGNNNAEILTLTIVNNDPNVINASITGATIGFVSDFEGNADFEYRLNGGPWTSLDFPGTGLLGSGTIPLAGGLNPGSNTLEFRSITPVISGFFGLNNNSFTVQGLQLQAQVIPEPASIALFGTLAAAAGVVGWRRRKTAAAV